MSDNTEQTPLERWTDERIEEWLKERSQYRVVWGELTEPCVATRFVEEGLRQMRDEMQAEIDAGRNAWPTDEQAAEQLTDAVRAVVMSGKIDLVYDLRWAENFAAAVLARLQGDTQGEGNGDATE